jgi:hypothetical protein
MKPGSDNRRHAFRHVRHALEDFEELRELLTLDADKEKLWHSTYHHLRHAVHRIGLEVKS